MVAYPLREDTVQLLKDTVNIADIIGEHVTLKKTGINLKGLCPFHSEKTPSFIVNPDRRSFHCFGCGEGGDVFTFMMKYHRLTFPDALKELARRYNVDLPERSLSADEKAKASKRENLFKINEKAADLFHKFLIQDPQAEKARQYLAERGLSSETTQLFRIGYAPESWDFLTKPLTNHFSTKDIHAAGLIVPKERGGYYDRFRNRIIFPINGSNGRIIGFGGRILGDGQPKYLNSPETPIFDKSRTLYGIYENRDSIRKENICFIVEGNFDLLSMVAHGIRNVIAPLGTALTRNHLRILKGYADEAVLLFDGDQAGLKAAMRAVPLFLAEHIQAKVVIIPDSDDPDTFLRSRGKENFTALLDNAKSLPEFVYEILVDTYGLTLEGKNRILQELMPIVASLKEQKMTQTIFVAHFSQKLGITPDQMLAGFAHSSPIASSQKEGKDTPKQIHMPMQQRQLFEFLISYPKYLPKFIGAGLEEAVTDIYGIEILSLLTNLDPKDYDMAPEFLLDNTAGPLRSFLSHLLVSAPVYSDEQERVDEILAWLQHNTLKNRKEKLIQRINEAELKKNVPLCLKLMEEKKAIDKALSF